MQAEAEHRFEHARALFTQAWETRQNDYEACVAAHFLARQQDSPQEMLHWNEVALEHADAVEGDNVRDSVREFYPSLYLNLGACHEALGQREEALRCYQLAAARLADLPAGPYGDVVRDAVARGLARNRRQRS
jgi:tetratricopeptide (TPR) repeat protein